MIITIDGPVATGKSTIAKKLASAIGFIYFDTGAMYRAFTYGVIKNNVNMDNPEELNEFINSFEFDIKIKHGERRYYIGAEDVTDQIRMDEVTSQVSRISANAKVRDKLVEYQRGLAKGVNAVFEGRDMGSVVFPEADLKIFLTGRPDIRAKRRFDEMKAKYPNQSQNLTLEKAKQDILARDEYDSKRDTSPLIRGEGAFEVDTSDLSIEDVVYKILEIKDTRKLRQTT